MFRETADGYPDITLLPRIANYFDITIDTLLGNDKSNDEALWEEYIAKKDKVWGNNEERVKLDLEYYRNYPKSRYRFSFAFDIAITIAYGFSGEELKKYLPLLKEVCEKIVNECTYQWYREKAIKYMSIACEDEDFEKWYEMCVADYDSIKGEILEKRLWEQEKRDESRLRYSVNNFYLICHFLTRYTRSWGGTPERSVELNKYRMKFMEFLGGGEVPEAWLFVYGRACLGTACASFGSGKKEDGYEYLEKALEIYEKWNAIPCGKPMDVGSEPIFGGVKKLKNKREILLTDGTEEVFIGHWTYFIEQKDELYNRLTQPHGWEWFDSVRGEDRWNAILERAKAMIMAE